MKVIRLFVLGTLIVLSAAAAFAGTTGKLIGVVTDASTRTPLPGATVFVEGTPYGAVAENDGNYLVLNLPPGTYVLRCRLLGYKDTRVENVRVSIDLTTEIDFKLLSTVMDIGESVTVMAVRPMVVKDLTATTAVVGAEEMASLPVTEVSEAVELQAGLVKDAGGNLHARGGRKGEIGFWIDGIPVTDVYDGGTVVDVNKEMVQELQVVSGAFNAEYGQAMSGIVNITTKEGSNKTSASVTAYAGDHLSTHDKTFTHIGNVNPLGTRNIEASVQGPIVKDKLYFFVNGRSYHSDGWLYGERRYNPSAVTIGLTAPAEAIEAVAPDYYDVSRALPNGQRAFQYVLGTNAFIDSMLTRSNITPAQAGDSAVFKEYYDRLRGRHTNGRGDGKAVSMHANDKWTGQAKLLWQVSSALKLTYNIILDNVLYRDYDRNYTYNPDGQPDHLRYGQTHIAQLTQALSNRTFYKLGVSYFTKDYRDHAFRDIHDPAMVHPYLGLQEPYSYKTGGTADTRFRRNTGTWLAKFDIESQLSHTHLVKTGVEFRRHRMFQESLTLRPIDTQTDINLLFDDPFIRTRVMPDSTIYASRYTNQPIELSAYLQDKMEFKQMIVNLGLRVDWFDPRSQVLADPTDPSIYNPIKPQNRYRDWGTDGVAGTNDADGSENNGLQDAGEPVVTLAERKAYWYRKTTTKLQVSPRLGVSFPITERGVIHFSYGHFFQIPRFERLYQNPDFELGSGTGNVGVIGNADLKPEMTVSGEIGLQQQLTQDVFLSATGFFRDIRDLAGTRAEEIILFGGSAKYSRFINSDFGFVRGIILSVNKRFAAGLSAGLDYSFQIAKGTSSDPEAARNALAGGDLPEVQLVPLDWDQRHTVNATVSYSAPTWGGSLIMQWGSGLPYTPRRDQDITSLLTNTQVKPSYFNADVRVYKDFRVGPVNLSVFAKVYNLLDMLNEVNVYDDTGRAGFTTDQAVAASTNPMQAVNTLDQWYSNPSHYSEPRRVEVGVTVGL